MRTRRCARVSKTQIRDENKKEGESSEVKNVQASKDTKGTSIKANLSRQVWRHC